MNDMTVNNWKLVDNFQHAQYYYKYRINNDMIACVVVPHICNGNRWLLRIGFSSTFDRWDNVAFEKSFDTLKQLKEFMDDESAVGEIHA